MVGSGVYNNRMSAEAQVRCCPIAYQPGFDSLREVMERLQQVSGGRYPFYEAHHSNTRTHRIETRFGQPSDGAIFLPQCDSASQGNPAQSGRGGCL